MDAMGFGTIGDVIAGIDWCMDNYIDVISMSFVDPTYSSAFHDISNMAYIQGIVLIGASGNDGDGNPATNDVLYPAKFDGVIAVSGIDEYDVVASFSSDGAEVEICAPAVNIESTWMGGGYQTHDGTSGACPYVSGTVALIRSTDINLPQFDGYDLDSDGKWDSWEIRNRLEDTADDLGDAGRDIFYGYGLVDAQEAVTGVQTTPVI
jgi:subtilisin family serine protease